VQIGQRFSDSVRSAPSSQSARTLRDLFAHLLAVTRDELIGEDQPHEPPS